MFGICFISASFGLSLFLSEINGNKTWVCFSCYPDYLCFNWAFLGMSSVGSIFGVLAAVFILLGANADDPDFFMQNNIIQVSTKIKTFL